MVVSICFAQGIWVCHIVGLFRSFKPATRKRRLSSILSTPTKYINPVLPRAGEKDVEKMLSGSKFGCVAELVYALVLGTSVERRESSSLSIPTKLQCLRSINGNYIGPLIRKMGVQIYPGGTNLDSVDKYRMRINEIVTEGLIKSVDREDFVDTIQRVIGDYTYHNDTYEVIVAINAVKMDKLAKKLTKLFDTLGWFISAIEVAGQKVTTLVGHGFNEVVKLYMEPKYDIEFPVPMFMYHVTKKEAAVQILRKGLVPKSRNKLADHPDRVYLALSEEYAIRFFNGITRPRFASRSVISPGKHVLLQIDSRNLQNKFHIDSKFVSDDEPHAVYTTTNIPPQAIKFQKFLYTDPKKSKPLMALQRKNLARHDL